MLKQELISVIMPAYNAEKYIELAIASVMNQTYENVELVIVDDGSIDDTVNCIKRCVSKCPDRIRLFIREKNGGTAAALNDAIEQAQGKYICWLSADDMYADDMIDSEVSFLMEHSQYDAVFSRYACINESNQFLCEYMYPDVEQEAIKRGMPGIVSVLLSRNLWHGCSLLAKAECFKREDRFNEKYICSQDYDFWLRLAADYDVGYLDQVNVFYRLHSGQGSRRLNTYFDEIKVFFGILAREDIIKKLLSKMHLNYTLENIMPYIVYRMKQYSNRKDELNALNAELRKYMMLIENGKIRFEDQ